MSVAWTQAGREKRVTAPVSLERHRVRPGSGYTQDPDSPVTKVGRYIPAADRPGDGERTAWAGLSCPRLPGSPLLTTPDLDDPSLLTACFHAVQLLNETGYLLACTTTVRTAAFSLPCARWRLPAVAVWTLTRAMQRPGGVPVQRGTRCRTPGPLGTHAESTGDIAPIRPARDLPAAGCPPERVTARCASDTGTGRFIQQASITCTGSGR